MGLTLTGIAQQLSNPRAVKIKNTTEGEVVKQVPKVQLIYAFNGTGKTRLSREFKEHIAPKNGDDEASEDRRAKVLYYNAFTEDLFYWDNDLDGDIERKLRIQPNGYTQWVLQEQGQDQNAITHFQRYTNDKLTPVFNQAYTVKDKDGKETTVPAFSEVTFSYERGNKERTEHIKISKGEESCFIWSIFYSLIGQVVEVLNVAELTDRETDKYNALEYIFIDDPVSSLDENHLIQLAIDVAELIKSSKSELKFIITTHSPLFFNVLYNELKTKTCYLMERSDDGSFSLNEKIGDSNRSFSYHLYLKKTLETAIAQNKIERFHFTLLRNLYEKTAAFLGYPQWSELLPDDKEAYYNRIIQFTNHNTLAYEMVAQPSAPEKNTVRFLLEHLTKNYGYWQQG